MGRAGSASRWVAPILGERSHRSLATSPPHATAPLGQGCRAATKRPLTSASVSAPMAPSFFPRRLCRPTCRAHRARGGWNHSRRCPVTRPPKSRDCPVDIRPVDIFAQRQHVWIARPTLKAIDQEQSLATVHHAIAGSPAARSPRGRRPPPQFARTPPSHRTSVQGPVRFVRRVDQHPDYHPMARRHRDRIFCSPGTTCRSIRRLRDSQNICCLMGGRASLPVAADRRRGARSGR